MRKCIKHIMLWEIWYQSINVTKTHRNHIAIEVTWKNVCVVFCKEINDIQAFRVVRTGLLFIYSYIITSERAIAKRINMSNMVSVFEYLPWKNGFIDTTANDLNELNCKFALMIWTIRYFMNLWFILCLNLMKNLWFNKEHVKWIHTSSESNELGPSM